jgi:hypothetical protein
MCSVQSTNWYLPQVYAQFLNGPRTCSCRCDTWPPYSFLMLIAMCVGTLQTDLGEWSIANNGTSNIKIGHKRNVITESQPLTVNRLNGTQNDIVKQ